ERLGRSALRADPVTGTIIVLSLLLSVGSIGNALDSQSEGLIAAEALRDAHVRMDASITQSFNEGRISAAEREVALERLDRMTPLFQQYADIIEQKAYAAGNEALFFGLVDAISCLNPGAAGGKLVGLLTAGKMVDAAYSIVSFQNSLEGFLQRDAYSAEAAALEAQLQQILGLDADALLRARMHHRISKLSHILDELRAEYPNDPEQLLLNFRWKADQDVSIWAENPRLYGDGERWATYEDFLEWMMARATEMADERNSNWFERRKAEIEDRLVAEGRNCQVDAIGSYFGCLFEQAWAGVPQAEAELACQNLYDAIPPNDAGGSVTMFGEALVGGADPNSVMISYPSAGGSVEGDMYYMLYEQTHRCTIKITADIHGSYSRSTCTMRGTGNMQIVYEGGVCVDVCGPTEASPGPCPVTISGSTTFQATLENGELRGAVGDIDCEPHCFGFLVR
ncbi:MAG: hypothetical protein PVJ07_06925, partial [Anaerolineales bacterium]